ncbi:MAG: type II CAAX endopeptidase family protein [Deltaproteobacteria bacterium]
MTSPIPSEPRTQPQLYHAPPHVAGAVWITVGGILTIYAIQVGLGAVIGGLAAAALGFVVVAVAMVIAARVGRFSLGVQPAAPRFVLAAVLIGLACWYLEIQLVLHLHPPGDTSRIEQVVERTRLPTSLIVLALLPAISEELVFRGVLARSLARFPIVAVVVSAALFSLYHLVPAQMLGTFPLGLALGLLAVRSGSIVPGMIAHLLNNATVLVVERMNITALDLHPNLAFAGASVLVLGGVALAMTGAAA